MRTKNIKRSVFQPKLKSPFERFLHSQTAGGLLLVICSLTALVFANSGLADWYAHIQHITAAFEWGSWSLSISLLHWVDDGLMVIFFFVVGLEIKREVLVGELSSPKKASLAVLAAIGGMVLPALIYYGFTREHPELVNGWGIPMATDIAFVLGILKLLGRRIPLSLKVFLTALAIVDDFGAIAVIAFFYTSDLNLLFVLYSLGFVGLSYLYGRYNGKDGPVFAVLGVLCWYFMYKSGVHATVAGVLMALTIPIRVRVGIDDLNQRLQDGVQSGTFELDQANIEVVEEVIRNASSPLHRFERKLHPWVMYLIVPAFAFFNAGVKIPSSIDALLTAPHIPAIFFGLVLGKPIGVWCTSFVAVRLGLAELPEDTDWPIMAGAAFLAGLGFTMSLFIAVLAFQVSPEHLEQAKLGILSGSVAATVVGVALMYLSTRKKTA